METSVESAAVLGQLRHEIQPLADVLQEAGQLGSMNISKLPSSMKGKTCQYRAYQRDPYILGFHEALPPAFGSFIRDDSKFASRRLVYTSTDLQVELSFRRGRTSVGRQKARPPAHPAAQMPLFPSPKPALGMKPAPSTVRWRAALLWDCPTSSGIHSMDEAMPFRLQLATEGTSLDENQWVGGFPIRAEVEDLIPKTAQYRKEDLDWDIDDESGTL